MELNADFSRRAVVHAASLAWTPSPIAGVERRMLDRIGCPGAGLVSSRPANKSGASGKEAVYWPA
jgi:hypothetical protein